MGRRDIPWAGVITYLRISLILMLPFLPAQAQSLDQLAPVSRIVIQIDAAIEDQRFLEPLQKRLMADLAPPLEIGKLTGDFNLSPSFLGKVDSNALIEQIWNSLDRSADLDVIHIFLIKEDMNGNNSEFLFANSYGGVAEDLKIIVISLSRLKADDYHLTAARVSKMIIKNTARVAGYMSSNRCVFGFPRSVEELDSLPDSWCEPDRSLLAEGGIARAQNP
ncbi:hypothetical protein [uncultured Roseovarius sp.]|uniref:hypothetical protein n=1 Tax=uncultured Roseovarius sp. TaxID=293344 RepID=UPI00260DD1CD|nr:hypothetical protein [uncultured Roseovarius sp.]